MVTSRDAIGAIQATMREDFRLGAACVLCPSVRLSDLGTSSGEYQHCVAALCVESTPLAGLESRHQYCPQELVQGRTYTVDNIQLRSSYSTIARALCSAVRLTGS